MDNTVSWPLDLICDITYVWNGGIYTEKGSVSIHTGYLFRPKRPTGN